MDAARLPDSPEKIASETRLLMRLRHGGAEGDRALKQLFGIYQPRFIKSLRGYGLSIEVIEEALQDAWIAIVEKAADYTPGALPSAWLWGFVRFERLDAMRLRKRRAANEVSDSDEAVAALVEQSMALLGPVSPERALAFADMRRCVRDAFAVFKRQHANEAWLLYAREVADWDLAQIAECRQSSLHATSEFLGQARRKFKPLVQPCLELREHA